MLGYHFCTVGLFILLQTHAFSLEGHDSSESENNQKTVMMNINGENVPVVLPVAEIPPNLPQTIITTPQHDDKIDDQNLVHLPLTLQDPSIILRDDPNQTPALASSQNPSTTPASNNPPQIPPILPLPPLNGSLPHPELFPIPTHDVSSLSTPPPAQAQPPNLSSTTQPTTTNSPSHYPSSNYSSVTSTPLTLTTVAPHPPTKSSPEKPSQNTTSIFIIAGLPMFGAQLFANDIFGPIYPVYTQSPAVIQYVTSPTVYYVQVIRIIHSIVPSDVIPLSSIMDLSLAITKIMRSNAENLDSVLVEEPDGPNIAPEVQISSDNGFRSALTGAELDIPTPNDVTAQIQNAVQTYTESVPEDIQNELTQALSENMAGLLKPLYQNIAYTRKLRFEDMDQQQTNTDQQLYRRDFSLWRRIPQDPPVVVAIPAVNETEGTLTTTATTPHIPVSVPVPPPVSVPVPPPVSVPVAIPSISVISTPHTPSALGAVAVPNPNGAYSLTATSAPANQPPIVINNVLPVPTLNPAAGADLINSLLNSATSPFSSIFSLIPNPFKIVYNIMNTIANVYPKIQLSILVGLSTAITQIIARVLEIIASFVGIFAALGRRDLSSDYLKPPPSTLNMDQVLNDLHKDIKEAVHTYIPEAPAKIKNDLTSALYENSLDAINDAVGPMQEQVNRKPQEIQETFQPEIPQPAAYSINENLRSKTDLFPSQDQDLLKVNNNELLTFPINNIVTGVGDDIFGNQDNIGKQIDQMASDFGQVSQDVFTLPNFDTARQNNN